MNAKQWTLLIPTILVALAAGPYNAGAAPAVDLQTFAQSLMTGGELPADDMTPQMRSAFPDAAQEQIRATFTGQHGPVKEVGGAWFDDELQGYKRYRVPILFENVTLDMQIALDGAGRIAGLTFVEHVEPPDSASTEKAVVGGGAPGVEPQPEAPGPEIEIEVGPEGRGLNGLIALPPGDGPFPAAVLVHGSGPNDRDETIGAHKVFRDIAWGLADRGVATLRYDKRSLVYPQELAELGDELTVDDVVVEDARAALALLRSRPEIDAKNVYIVGHSLGGTLAPRIAQAEPHPAGIVSLAGSTLPLPEKILEQSRYIVGLDGEVSPEEETRVRQIEAAVKTLRAALNGEIEAPPEPLLGAPIEYFRDYESVDPAVVAADLGLPIFVVQGERDYQVTMDDFALWQEKLNGLSHACLRSYAGLDHLFRYGEEASTPASYHEPGPFHAPLLDDLAAWLRDRSCPQKP